MKEIHSHKGDFFSLLQHSEDKHLVYIFIANKPDTETSSKTVNPLPLVEAEASL